MMEGCDMVRELTDTSEEVRQEVERFISLDQNSIQLDRVFVIQIIARHIELSL